MSDEFHIALTVDATGTRCPVPLLRAKLALKDLQAGQYLKVLATDPSAKADFEAMLSHLPHALVSHELSNEQGEDKQRIDTFIIKKG